MSPAGSCQKVPAKAVITLHPSFRVMTASGVITASEIV